MFSNEFLTTTDNGFLISRLGLTEEFDGRNPVPSGRGVWTRPRLSPEVVVEKEDRSEEKECQQSKRITGIAPEEGHRV